MRKVSTHYPDGWKISSPANRVFTNDMPHAIPMRTQSPFTRLERYKPRTPMIDTTRQRQFSPRPRSHIIEKDSPPIENIMDDLEFAVSARKALSSPKIQDSQKATTRSDDVPWTWWSGYAFFLTCCIPNCVLSVLGGKKTKLIQQAWREKVQVFFWLCT
jgi:hypothetical protein